MSFRPPSGPLPAPCLSVACPPRPARLSAGNSPASSWRFADGTGCYPAAGTPDDHHQPRRLTGPGHDRRKGHAPCPAAPEPAWLTRHRRRSRGTESPSRQARSPNPCPHPVRRGCPARQADPGGEPGEALRHADAGFPLPASRAGRRSASRRQPSNLGRPGRRDGRGPACLSPAPPRRKPGRAPAWPRRRHCAGVPGRCPRRRPSGEAGCPGKTGHLPPRRQPTGGSQAAALPLVTAVQPSRSPRSPAYRQAARRGFRDWRGRAYHSPYTSCVPAVDLSLT